MAGGFPILSFCYGQAPITGPHRNNFRSSSSNLQPRELSKNFEKFLQYFVSALAICKERSHMRDCLQWRARKLPSRVILL